MIVSFLVACFFQWGAPALGIEERMAAAGCFNVMDYSSWKLIIGILITTVAWLAVTYLTAPEKREVLEAFCAKIRAGGPGWRKIEASTSLPNEAKGWDVPTGILCMVIGCLAVWSALFGVGYLLYAKVALGAGLLVVAVVSTALLMRLVGKIKLS